MTFVHGAQQNAITDVYSDNQPQMVPTLAQQIAALGHELPGRRRRHHQHRRQ